MIQKENFKINIKINIKKNKDGLVIIKNNNNKRIQYKLKNNQ